jgi:spore germination cell wall hydrolase CwlJ-like protein
LNETWQSNLARAFGPLVAIGAVALVLFITLIPARAENGPAAEVVPLPVPHDLLSLRSQPAFGPTLVPLEPGQQPLSSALLSNYVARQQALRSVDVGAEQTPPELNSDVLMGYIARTSLGQGNSAVSAIASFTAPAVPRVEPTVTSDALAAYVANGYKSTGERLEHANSERDCLAQAIYHEARGESATGQLAVANVIVNRARSGKFPSTLCGVIYQNANKGYHRCQFTFACDGRSDAPGERRAWTHSAELAREVYAEFALGEDVGAIPGSALYYHTTSVRPSWASTYNAVAKVGAHVFYSPN